MSDYFFNRETVRASTKNFIFDTSHSVPIARMSPSPETPTYFFFKSDLFCFLHSKKQYAMCALRYTRLKVVRA